MRTPVRDNVMRKKADIGMVCSDFRDPSGSSYARTPTKIGRLFSLLFHSSDIFWKKSIQGFSLLHLKECFNPKTPLNAF